jgi:hypothetical protein
MGQNLIIADWLEELATYGTPRFQDAETAYPLSEAIKHWYLVILAIKHRVGEEYRCTLRKVEKRTTLRAEWTSDDGTTERYFDYVLKKTIKE